MHFATTLANKVTIILYFIFPVKSYYKINLSVRNNIFKLHSSRVLQYNGWSDVMEFQIKLDTNNSFTNPMYLYQSSTPSQGMLSSKLILNPRHFPLELVDAGINDKKRMYTIGTTFPWKQEFRMINSFNKKCCEVPMHSFGVKSALRYGM
jgi:hypothetical protein